MSVLYAVVGARAWAHAQDDGAATERSQKLFAAALEAKRARELPRALCLMQRAQLAWSNPAFSFNVAQLQLELGMCSEAQRNYEVFLEHEADPARRKQAELGLAELPYCAPIQRAAPLPDAASSSCTAWAENALAAAAPSHAAHSGEAPAVPTPAEVARTQSNHGSPIVVSGPAAPRRGKRTLPAYLPWVFVGVGALCVGLAGYELSQISASEREIKTLTTTTQLHRLQQEGREAQTLFWVLGGTASLTLAGALALALLDGDDPAPE